MGFGEFFRWGLIFQVIAIIHIEVLPDADLLRVFAHGFSRRRRIKVLEAVVVENPAVGNLVWPRRLGGSRGHAVPESARGVDAVGN